MSSSLANAIKRKTHKERSQPAARQKYGLLEKKKDYVERARDFHRKESTLKALRRKAEQRNPDEFYFAMQRKSTKGGVHDNTEGKQYTAEELALMRSQDVKYLVHKERVEAEKIAKLKESLHFIGAPAKNKHTVFVDSTQEAAGFEPEKYLDTPKELLGRTFNRPRRETLAKGDAVRATFKNGLRDAGIKKLEKRKLAAYRELQQRLERQAKLARTAARLSTIQQVQRKGVKQKLTKREIRQQEEQDRRAAEARAALDGSRASGPQPEGSALGRVKVFKWKRERLK